MDALGSFPRQRYGAEKLSILVERPAVEVQNAESLAQRLVPLGLALDLPLECAPGFVDPLCDPSGLADDVFNEEIADFGVVR